MELVFLLLVLEELDSSKTISPKKSHEWTGKDNFFLSMDFLPHLDAAWRGDSPEESDDFWFQMYEQACPEHREMIDAEKTRCGLTRREATQKVFKCSEIAAQSDSIPSSWERFAKLPLTAGEVADILWSTNATLSDALESVPESFDDAIAMNVFLRGPHDIQGGDRWLRKG